MKIIFLDIDGVLNSENHGKELHKLLEQGKMSEKKYYDTWDLPYEGTLLSLKKIVDETGAQIVLSSSWRLLGKRRINVLNNLFKPYGFQIMDVTPHGVMLDDLEKLGFDKDKCYDAKYRHAIADDVEDDIADAYKIKTWDRGAEIAMWLSQHQDVESFVILDDDWLDIVPYYEEHLVQTLFNDWGLTFELANKAIEILNKDERRL